LREKPIGERIIRLAEERRVYTPEDYHEIYDAQSSTVSTYMIATEYTSYLDLLQTIYGNMLEFESIGSDLEFDMEMEGTDGPLHVLVRAVEEKVAIRLTWEYSLDDVILTSYDDLMLSFENDVFQFDYLNTFSEYPGSYSYSGYIENERFFFINVNDYVYSFMSMSDIDGAMLSFSRYAYGETNIGWYDPLSMRRSNFTWEIPESGGEPTLCGEYYDLFNEHGVYMMYYLPGYDGADTAQVWWSLLDATGWDYVIDDPENDLNSPEVELYRDGERLFAEDERFIVRGELTSSYTCLYLVLEESNDYFTEDILNLSAFGLAFDDTEITPVWIEAMRATEKASIAAHAVYENVDLLAEDAADRLQEFLPESIRSILTAQTLPITGSSE
jgi:hypothetical protein